MTRWMLALLFAFGSVTFLSACEEKSETEEAGDAAKQAGEEAGDAAKDGIEAGKDALEGADH